MNGAKRNTAIDVLKGIGILLVIVGHTYGPLTRYIYLFHMPIFFMAAGYCYSFHYSDSISGLAELLKKRLKSLWLPYAVTNTVSILLNNVFIQAGLYTTDEAFLSAKGFQWPQALGHYYSAREAFSRSVHSLLFNQATQLTGATWFLEVLFFVTLGFALADYCVRSAGIKRLTVRWYVLHIAIAATCLLAGNAKGRFPILGKYRMATILVVLALYEMGIACRIVDDRTSISPGVSLCTGILSGAALVFLNNFGFVELSSHRYSSILFLLISSALGWVFIYGISCWIGHRDGLFNRILCFYGRNTLPVLLMHLIFFKPVTAVIIQAKGLPGYYLASFPVISAENGVWAVYAVVSIALSALLILIWSKAKGVVRGYGKSIDD